MKPILQLANTESGWRGRLISFAVAATRIGLAASAFASLAMASPSFAQSSPGGEVIVDQTLTAPTPIPLVDNEYAIEEDLHGARAGTNLFFSFTRFDVGENESATFYASPAGPGTENVLVRVTGLLPDTGIDSAIGRIDGTVRLDAESIGEANLFMINPFGWLFGAGSQFDVRGAVHVSTADRLGFAGAEPSFFSAIEPESSRLVTGDPHHFGFLGTELETEIRFDGDPIDFRSSGFGTPDITRFAAIGGSVVLNEAIDADGALVELAAVGSATVDVPVDVATFDPLEPGIGDLGRIEIFDRIQTGTITSEGVVVLRGGSVVFDTRGEGQSITAGGRLEDLSSATNDDLASTAIDWVVSDSATLRGGASMEVLNVLSESGGGIRIRAGNQIDIAGTSELLTARLGDGSSDGVHLEATEIRLTNGAAIRTTTRDEEGSAIRVVADSLALEDGARIETDTIGAGRAGRIGLDARAVSIDRGDPEAVPSLVASSNTPTATGGSGEITLDVESLELRGGSQISTTTAGDASEEGDATGGNITISAQGTFTLEGQCPASDCGVAIPSGLFARSDRGDEVGPSGASGDIVLTAASVDVLDSGRISTESTGSGSAGAISIIAAENMDSSRDVDHPGRIRVIGGSALLPSSISSRGNVADAGEVSLEALRIDVVDGGEISATSRGNGSPGTVRIRGDDLLVEGERSNIAALTLNNVEDNAPGSIDVELSGTFRVSEGATVTAAARDTDPGGLVSIGARRLIVDSGGEVSASAVVDGGVIEVDVRDAVIIDGGRVAAEVLSGVGGNVLFNAPAVVVSEDSIVTASATGLGAMGGRIVVDAEAILGRPDPFQATAPSGPEFAGSVEINSPVVNLASQVVPETADFLRDTQLSSLCRARRSALRQGSLTLEPIPGLPLAATAPLLPREPFVREGNQESIHSSLLQSNEAFFQGRFEDSAAAATTAIRVATERGDGVGEIEARIRRGDALTALRRFDEARVSLTAAAIQADESSDPLLTARAQNSLGNLESIARNRDAAASAYAASFRAAEVSQSLPAQIQSLTNEARSAAEFGAIESATLAARRGHSLLDEITTSLDVMVARIHLAETWTELARINRDLRREALISAHRLLLTASGEAGAAGNLSLRSRVSTALAVLYSVEGGREEEALYLANTAIELARRARTPELAARAHAVAGGLHVGLEDPDAAIGALTRAATVYDSIRISARSQYGAQSGYREVVLPIHQALFDLLVPGEDSSSLAELSPERQSILRAGLARRQLAELRDYYADPCIEALEEKSVPLEHISATAAVIYPIVLEDRLVLLVGGRWGMKSVSVPVAAVDLKKLIGRFEQLLIRPTNQYRAPARSLYDWLIAPIENVLDEKGVDTLVFVPPAPLRTVPMSALHDGEKFLIERYAVATAPTLEIVAPERFALGRQPVLIAGISQAVGDFAPLESVPEEVEAVQSLVGGNILLNEAFRVDQLERALRDRSPSILHLATHARFTDDPKTTFVLAHDGKLELERLAEMISRGRFSEDPLELLVLSACETAVGNDRAVLGLAGVAVRAGARAAVGSLWRVSDRATKELITGFYQGLAEDSLAKAEALRRAQRRLIKTSEFQHPYYWAGFIVLNNWL